MQIFTRWQHNILSTFKSSKGKILVRFCLFFLLMLNRKVKPLFMANLVLPIFCSMIQIISILREKKWYSTRAYPWTTSIDNAIFFCFRKKLYLDDNGVDDTPHGRHVQQGHQGHRWRSTGAQIQNKWVHTWNAITNNHSHILEDQGGG